MTLLDMAKNFTKTMAHWARAGFPVVEAEEFADGVLVEFGEDGQVVGIELHRTMQRVLDGHKMAAEKPYLANVLASATA